MKQFNLLLQIVAAILAIVVSAMTLQALRQGGIPIDIFEREPEVEEYEQNRDRHRAEASSYQESPSEEETGDTFVVPADVDACAQIRFQRRDEAALTPEDIQAARVAILREHCRDGVLQQTEGTYTEPPPGDRTLRWQARQRPRT